MGSVDKAIKNHVKDDMVAEKNVGSLDKNAKKSSVNTESAPKETATFFLDAAGVRKPIEGIHIKPYHFAHPRCFSHSEMDFLQQAYSDWLRFFKTYGTLTLKTDFQVKQEYLNVQTYANFLTENAKSVIIVFSAAQTDNLGFIALPIAFALNLIRKLLGSIQKETLETRVILTPIEKNLLRQFAEGCLQHWSQNIVNDIKPISLQILGIETGTRFIPKPKQTYIPYLVQKQTWTFGEETGIWTLAFPCSLLTPILEKFKAEQEKFNQHTSEDKNCVWRGIYSDIDIPVTVEWQQTVTLKSIMEWQPNTVLNFPITTLEQTILKTNGIPKVKGRLGLSGEHIAFEIKGNIDE